MVSREIADIIIEPETARIDEVMLQTSPATVLARMESELRQTHGKNGMPALTAIVGLVLALLSAPAYAAPDAASDAPTVARALMADFDEQLAADAVLASRSGQRLVLSALLCEATSLLTSEDTHTTAAGRMRLVAQAETARERLAVLEIQPLACDAWPVARLVQCLDILPSISCTEDDVLQAQVATAERLMAVRP